MALNIVFQGSEYPLDLDAVDLDNLAAIEAFTGLCGRDFLNSITVDRVSDDECLVTTTAESVRALWWLACRQNGEELSLGSAVDEPAFLTAFASAVAVEAGVDVEVTSG